MQIKMNYKVFKKVFSLFLVFTILIGSMPSYADNNLELLSLDGGGEKYLEKIRPEVQDLFNGKEDLIDVLVYMEDKADVLRISRESAIGRTPYAKELSSRKAVVNALKDVAETSQVDLIRYLDDMEILGDAEYIESFNIANIVHVKASRKVIEDIAKRKEVKAVYLNETIKLDLPIINDITLESSSEDEVEWNIKQVGAPNVWEELGIDGSGVVIGIIDSGVKWDHPALKEKWRGYDPVTGKTTAEGNWYDPVSGKALPEDPESHHGTHVAGTILGQEADGTNSIGVAPGAKWIAANAFTGPTGGSQAVLLACAEWMLTPGGKAENAPDIVNNSWGGGANTSEWFKDIVDSWRAAGILPVFAAGNQKSEEPAPWPGSIQNPANLLTTFSVGATDVNNIRGDFSKLGPSLFDPEGNVIKPDISAPGVNIRSAIGDGTYAGGWNGTSMASPHIAGVAALMKSANTSITIEEMETIMKDTAIALTDSDYPNAPNMGYGYGLVNSFDAVSKVLGTGQGTIEGNVYIEGEDTQEPIIIHEEVEDVYVGEEVILTALISDDVSITEAKLLIKNKNMTEWHEIDMILKSGDPKNGSYEAVLPGDLIIDGGVDYKIKATDFGGNVVTSSEYKIGILFGIKADKYSNDFEKEIKGWKLSGDWEWGEPTSFSGPTAKSGKKVMGTKIDSYDTNPNILSKLTMPAIDLRDTNMKSASLELFQWFNISGTHKAKINISIDGGNTWELLKEVKGKSNNWEAVYINLNKFIGNEEAVLIEFVFDTNAEFGYSIGWYIDDIILVGEDNTPPAVPRALKAETQVAGIVLNWDKVTDPDLNNYKVYRSLDQEGPYEILGTTSNPNYMDSDVINGEIYYYVVTAVDFAGNESDYSEKVSHEYVEVKVIFSANFEEDNGDFIDGIVPIDLPYGSPKNDWEWGAPTSGPGSALAGTKVWATKLAGNYDWDHSAFIESPIIEMPTDEDVVLYVDQWLDANQWLDKGTVDYGNIQISEDDGDSWTVLGNNMAGNKKWETVSRDLSGYKGKSVKLRFYFFSNGSMNAPGWYIDSVYILPKAAGQKTGIKIDSANELQVNNKLQTKPQGVLPIEATLTVLETGRSVRSSLADGSFTMKHVASQEGKPWTLIVESYGYRSKEFSIDLLEDESINKTITLEELPKGSIKGNVSTSFYNTPVANAKVRILEEPGLDIVTDSKGDFVVNDLYEGLYTINITSKDHYSTRETIEVIANKDNPINISMNRFVRDGDPDEISYDDGTYEEKRVFTNAGAGFAVRFTPEKMARLTSAKIFFVDDHDKALGDEINIGVVKLDERGNIVHFAPMETIKVELGAWNTIDLTEFDVMTDEDFYIVTYQIHPNSGSPSIGIDTSSTANRSYVFNGGSLVKLNGADGYNIPGGMLMRAVMEYPKISQPVGKYPLIIEDWSMRTIEDDLEVGLTIFNSTEVSANATIMLQAYDENNRPYKVVVYKNRLINSGLNEEKLILYMPNYPKGISKVKVFIWDNLENMKPLTESIEIR